MPTLDPSTSIVAVTNRPERTLHKLRARSWDERPGPVRTVIWSHDGNARQILADLRRQLKPQLIRTPDLDDSVLLLDKHAERIIGLLNRAAKGFVTWSQQQVTQAAERAATGIAVTMPMSPKPRLSGAAA